MKNLTGFLLILSISACESYSQNAQLPDDSMRASFSSAAKDIEINYLDYPKNGAVLGQGWHSRAVGPANGTCIEFSERQIPGHSTSVNYKEVNTRYELSKSMNRSVSGTYSSGYFNASGSADFQRSTELEQNSTNILATILVNKGDRFVAPQLQYSLQNTPSTNTGSAAVRLTPYALSLLNDASAGKDRFQAECGDSFIYTIRQGASLYALLTLDGYSRTESASLTARLSGSGWGSTATVSGQNATASGINQQDTRVKMYQVGGPMLPAALDVSQFRSTIRSFIGTGDPVYYPVKPHTIGVAGYHYLANWPESEIGGPDELDPIIALLWLFEDLYEEYFNAISGGENYFILNGKLSDQIAQNAELFILSSGGICKLNKQGDVWSTHKDNSAESNCDVATADSLGLASPWNAEGILARFSEIAKIKRLLETNPKSCLIDSQTSRESDSCDLNSTISYLAGNSIVGTIELDQMNPSGDIVVNDLKDLVEVPKELLIKYFEFLAKSPLKVYYMNSQGEKKPIMHARVNYAGISDNTQKIANFRVLASDLKNSRLANALAINEEICEAIAQIDPAACLDASDIINIINAANLHPFASSAPLRIQGSFLDEASAFLGTP